MSDHVPNGWKLVPVEPTTEMNCAAVDEFRKTLLAPSIYRAMLDAAPKAPSEEDDAFTCVPVFTWSDIRPVRGTSIVSPSVMLLDEEGQCLGIVTVLQCESNAVRGDVQRALGAAGNPAKMRRFLNAARHAEAEANERAEVAEEEMERLQCVIERDRTKTAESISILRSIVAGRSWLGEGRGNLAWDDDRYQEEFRGMLEEFMAALDPLKILAADWSDCPKDFQSARIDWKARAERAEAALKGAVAAWDKYYQQMPRDAEDEEFGAMQNARAALKLADGQP